MEGVVEVDRGHEAGIGSTGGSDPELHAPDFVEAVARFRTAVKEFTASVNKLDDIAAAAINPRRIPSA